MWNQWFYPEPQIKGLSFAKSLQSIGFSVDVLTGFPNYPGGVIYKGYSLRPFQNEFIDGIFVRRVALYPSHDKSSIKRFLNYVSFGLTSFLAALIFRRVDAIYACGPPVTVGLAAVLVGKIRGIPVIYDIQDLWPESLSATGMFNSPVGIKLIGLICKFVYRHAISIVVQSPGIKTKLIKRGVSEEKISVIYNWCDEGLIFNSKGTQNSLNESAKTVFNKSRFPILYAGNIGKAQALHSILDAGKILLKYKSPIDIYIMGDGVDKVTLERIVKDERITNVFILPAVPMSEVGPYLESANALLVHLNASDLFKSTIPGKTQAYLANGKPIVMAVEGDAADLIRSSGGGVVAKPCDPESIANAMIYLSKMSKSHLKEIGDSGREYYWSKLSIDIGALKFKDIFLKLVNENE